MGAEVFSMKVRGKKTAKTAFDAAVEDARYAHGHNGYTGTIAEKGSFVLIEVPENYIGPPKANADQLIEDCDPRIDSKWGPAGCIALGDDEFLFFGWASS